MKCFTLAELLVVMAISSMVVMLAYTTYLYVNKIIINSYKNDDYYKTTISLHALLKNDFDLSSIIKKNENTFEFVVNDSILLYKIEAPYIIRRNDTFNIQLKSYEIDEVSNNTGIVKTLTLITTKDSLEMIFIKDYSGDVVFNNQIEFSK